MRSNIVQWLMLTRSLVDSLVDDNSLHQQLELAASRCIDAIKKGNKILIIGNGGSAADAQHIAAELIGRFKKDRAAIPAIALTVDTSIITSIGNDYDFSKVFSRQIEGLARNGDVLIALSTSGRSKNVINGIRVAQEKGITCIGLSGREGWAEISPEISLIVPSADTAAIQQMHITLAHILCSLIEEHL